MNTLKLLERTKRDQKNAISPIIATLLLILIAIAAGVVVYAYVMGYVTGSTSGGPTGSGQISVDTASSVSNGVASTITVYIRNIGGVSETISNVYVTDPAGNLVQCSLSSADTLTCSNPSAGTDLPTASTSLTNAMVVAGTNTPTVTPSQTGTLTIGDGTHWGSAGLSPGSYKIQITTVDGTETSYTVKTS